nr:MAG TPA: hypothetical protein [Bacteriophage sp.]
MNVRCIWIRAEASEQGKTSERKQLQIGTGGQTTGILIDADKLKADLEKAISKNEDMDCLDFLRVASFIDAQPTAYDPDKVVTQLEDYGNEETHYYKNTPYEKCIEECIGKAIQIVEGGGVDA